VAIARGIRSAEWKATQGNNKSGELEQVKEDFDSRLKL
jgi:hypothetical protein